MKAIGGGVGVDAGRNLKEIVCFCNLVLGPRAGFGRKANESSDARGFGVGPEGYDFPDSFAPGDCGQLPEPAV